MSCLTGTKGLWHWFSLAVAKCLKLFLLADVQSWLFFSWVVSRALWRLPHWTACPVGKTFASIGWLMLPPTAVGTRWTNPLFGSLHSSKDNSWMKFEMGPGWLSSAEPTWNPWETPSLSLLSVHSTQAAFCLSLSLHFRPTSSASCLSKLVYLNFITTSSIANMATPSISIISYSPFQKNVGSHYKHFVDYKLIRQ